MATKVSFIIKLSDRFSVKGKKIKKSAELIGNAVSKLSTKFKTTNTSTEALAGKFNRLRGESKELIRDLKKTSQSSRKLSKRFKGLSKDSKVLTNNVKKGMSPAFTELKQKAVGALGALAVFFGVSKFISVGADFQDALADLSSITGATGKELKFLSDESLRLAKSSRFAQSIVALAFKDIASAKSELLKDPKGLSIVTEQALLLANAAGISVPDAVRASVGALNQFGKGADQAARFVNVIAAGAKVGASSVDLTADALKNAGTVAALFGLTFEETNAILQVFAKSGLKGAEAGTALRGVLSKLEKQGPAFAASTVGIITSLERVKKSAFSNVQIINKFGEENQRAILILRENVPLIKQWTKELTGTNVAQEQAAIRLATFNSKIKGLGISIKDSLIKAFLRLEPEISKLVEDLTSFFDNLDPERIKAFADELVGLVKIVSLLGKGLGLVASVFTGVGTFLGEQAAQSVEFLAGRGDVAEQRRVAALLPQRNGKSIIPTLTNKSEILATLEQQKSINNVTSSAPIVNLERDKGQPARSLGATQTSSKTTLDVNIRAPKDVVKSVQTRETGGSSDLNMGINMLVAT